MPTLETADGGTITLTSAELDAALGGRLGNVREQWLFEWRNTAYQLLDDPIRGAVLPGGTLKLNVDADVPLTGDITVEPRALPFTLTDANNHIAISLEVLIDGIFVRIPQALAKVESSDEEVLESATGTAKVSLSDLSTYLLGKTTAPIVIAAGANVIDQIASILDTVGLQHSLTPSGDLTPAIISVGPGTTWRALLNRLTDVANLYPVAPDGRGTFGTERRVRPQGASDQTYAISEPTLLIPPLRRRSDRTGRFWNRAINLFDHPDRTPGYVEVVNNDPDSNISIPRVGETITQVLPNGGYVINDTRAVEYATWALRHQHALANVAEIRTVLDPRQGIRSQYTINIPGIEDGTMWELLGFSMPLVAGGVMTHEIGRSVPVEVTRLA